MIKLSRDTIIDFQVNINMDQKHDFVPKSELIKKYIDSEVERVLDESLENDKDLEMLSFKPESNFILKPHFNGLANYNSAGFTDYFITANTLYIEESFYLFDIYDSYSDNNQILLSRNYVKGTKIIKNNDTSILFENKKITKEYTNIYVPTYFTYSSNTCYMRIQFFNSVNGKLRYFQCKDDSNNLLDNSKNYLKISLDKNNYTYQIVGGEILSTNPNTYKISEIIESQKEQESLNKNILTKLAPTLREQKIITSKGKFI